VEEGLRRELYEELGLVAFEIGPTVWLRHHTFNWGEKRISQREEYRIVHAPRFEPKMSDLVEAKVLDHFRWWRIADLASCREPLTPRSLPAIITTYLLHGAPTGSLEVERLID
jgi:8-oxo-dGTP pyrophosphatase MutT (NUDIX family)